MQAQIDRQGKRIDDFNEGMERLSAATAASAAKDAVIKQLRDEMSEKDACIQKLRAKFSQASASAAGAASGKAGWLTPRTSRAVGSADDKELTRGRAVPLHSSLNRGKFALEQMEFLSKVFEQEIGILNSSASHNPRPSPIIAPDKLQAMLALDSQAPPPNSSHHNDAVPSSRPLFLARRLRLSTPPQPVAAPASLLEQPLPLVSA
jgi:hypothetical protein